MNRVTVGGPPFEIAANKAFIVLGHSERLEVGNLLEEKLDDRNIFEDIEVVTLNKSAAFIGRRALRMEMKNRIAFTHSAAVMRIAGARQIVAINPSEQVSFRDLLEGAVAIGNDPIVSEIGAHKTGNVDLIKAGFELLRSPITSIVTPSRIARGYSTVDDLSVRAEDFPAGRAIVHSSLDGFGFAGLADMDKAARNGITTVMIDDHYHNEILFAPQRTLDLLSPAILPDNR